MYFHILSDLLSNPLFVGDRIPGFGGRLLLVATDRRT